MSEETGTPFKIGDQVQLSSSGPVMTVEEVVCDELLICVWWQKRRVPKGEIRSCGASRGDLSGTTLLGVDQSPKFATRWIGCSTPTSN